MKKIIMAIILGLTMSGCGSETTYFRHTPEKKEVIIFEVDGSSCKEFASPSNFRCIYCVDRVFHSGAAGGMSCNFNTKVK